MTSIENNTYVAKRGWLQTIAIEADLRQFVPDQIALVCTVCGAVLLIGAYFLLMFPTLASIVLGSTIVLQLLLSGWGLILLQRLLNRQRPIDDDGIKAFLENSTVESARIVTWKTVKDSDVVENGSGGVSPNTPAESEARKDPKRHVNWRAVALELAQSRARPWQAYGFALALALAGAVAMWVALFTLSSY